MNKGAKFFVVLLLSIFLSACASTKEIWKAVTADRLIEEVEWTEDELSNDPATRTLNVGEHSSFHVIYLRGSEKPHTHDQHDLYAFMISGRSRLKMAGKEYLLGRGDSVYIPRGTVHWAENIDPEGTEAYVIFVPAMTELDYQELGKR